LPADSRMEAVVRTFTHETRSSPLTMSSGGLLRASLWRRSWTYAVRSSFLWPLYSQAKRSRFQTSAKPSPPPASATRFSKAYWEPIGHRRTLAGSS
jgi:hypothetical protein